VGLVRAFVKVTEHAAGPMQARVRLNAIDREQAHTTINTGTSGTWPAPHTAHFFPALTFRRPAAIASLIGGGGGSCG
jgi:hypothetical protein